MEVALPQALHGRIEVISGCMFSGKTEELIRRIRRCQYAHQPFQVFKPARDNRYSETEVVTHLKDKVPCTVVRSAAELLSKVDSTTCVVGIDEAQFFDAEIVAVCNELATRGVRVIVAGLDRDAQNRTFGPMGDLLAAAECVTKLAAVCMKCGKDAQFTQSLMVNTGEHIDASGNVVVVGSGDLFQARCREHFLPA